MLKDTRLLGFTIGKQFRSVPKNGEVLSEHEKRVILLDQGGATGPVVRTEPKKWKPLPDKTAKVIANGMKYLVSISNNDKTYYMRSEAVEEYRSDEWGKKSQFVINDLTFKGDRPLLAKGDLALFSYESGNPELVITSLGKTMSTVSKHETKTVRVFITYSEESEKGIYIDGYRSIGSLTAFPISDMTTVQQIRGGRLRWRPKKLDRDKLQRSPDTVFPVAFEDKSSNIHVVVSILQPSYTVVPQSNTQKIREGQGLEDSADPGTVNSRPSQNSTKKQRHTKSRGSWGTWGHSGGR
jgi:hypothetical protein